MKLCMVCGSKFDDAETVCAKDGARLFNQKLEYEAGMLVDGRYRLLELVGKGSVGRVFRAQLPDESCVAIKILHENLIDDVEALARFRREGQMLSIIEHPNILELREFGELESGHLFFSAEFLEGQTLADLIAQQGFLTVSETLPIIEQVCAGLTEAHSYGFIHRDMKPSNIMIVSSGLPELQVKLLDFSLAKLPPFAIADRVTRDGMVRGSPAYMSPEQCASMEVDGRSDLYSLAIVIFETLTGHRPFPGKHPVVTMQQQIKDVPPRMMSVRHDLYFSEELELLIQASLSKNPNDRPQSLPLFWERFKLACINHGNQLSFGDSAPPNRAVNPSTLTSNFEPIPDHAAATVAGPLPTTEVTATPPAPTPAPKPTAPTFRPILEQHNPNPASSQIEPQSDSKISPILVAPDARADSESTETAAELTFFESILSSPVNRKIIIVVLVVLFFVSSLLLLMFGFQIH